MSITKREARLFKILAVCIMTILTIAGIMIFAPDAHADIASGTYGTAAWDIDDNGVLTIHAGKLSTNASAISPWNSYKKQIKKVVVEPGVVAGASMNCLFSGFSNCTEMDLSGLDTSNVTRMYELFYECSKLTNLDLSNFNTSAVTNMQQMFQGCSGLTNLDLSSFDTSKVTSMYNMFHNCSKLTNLDLSHFNTSAVTSMGYMFYGCSGLTSLDLSHFNTSAVTNMASMFYGCSGLANLDLSSFNTSAVTTMVSMFLDCSELTSLDLSSFDTNKVTTMSNMFYNCSKLTNLDLSHFNTSAVTNMESMFSGCSGLANLDLSHFNTSAVTSMGYMFYGCSGLTNLDLSSFDTSKVTFMGNMFSGCSNLQSVKLGGNFNFKGKNITSASYQATLPIPPQGTTTGKWIREDETLGPMTAAELRDQQSENPELFAGTWIWEEQPTKYTVKFVIPTGVIGGMENERVVAAEAWTIPTTKLYQFNHKFDHWDASDGNTYVNGATIPANRYNVGDVITLTAVMVELDNTVNMVDGTFDLTLYGNEGAIFSDIPAGTAYQVWEETPDGWVLISQTNTSGVIEPLQTSEASFVNQYIPGTVTATFYGSKIMDGKAAADGAYTFELLENDIVIQTKNNGDGGFISFDTITYDSVGEHTYTVREVIGSNDIIDYDHHIETIQVSITEGENGTLHAEVTYDDDGIRFVNRTKPGILKIIKETIGLTEANKDTEFTFNVILQSENGTLVEGGQYYWYTEDIH